MDLQSADATTAHPDVARNDRTQVGAAAPHSAGRQPGRRQRPGDDLQVA